MPKCKTRACGGIVVLADTTRGRVIALDAAPAADGTYVLRATSFGRPLAEYVGKDPVDPDTARYRVHAASCAGRVKPGPRGWRKRAQEQASGD